MFHTHQSFISKLISGEIFFAELTEDRKFDRCFNDLMKNISHKYIYLKKTYFLHHPEIIS